MAAPKLNPPFRAEHLGSLLRPDYILEARKKFDENEVTAEQLKELEGKAIKDAIKMQKEVGLKSLADGEYSWTYFYDGFFDHLEGFTGEHCNSYGCSMSWYVPDIRAFLAENTKPAGTTLCTGKIKHVKSGYLPQFEELKKFKNIKMTLDAPEWYFYPGGEHAYDRSVYANDEEHFNGIAAAYRTELEILYNAGCRNVQIDDPLLAYFCDVSMLKGIKEDGVDPADRLDAYIRLYNNCLRDRATKCPELVVGLHLCKGNFRHSMHFSEGGYEHIAIKLFNQINVDAYYLEYGTERADTFDALQDLPKNKTVVLSLITSKFPELENIDDLEKRVHEAAKAMASRSRETEEEVLQRI
ncbi:UROD/MetE-like protein [Trichophaea hybrida]|nr:UROD/MetE-like protein [Trichophaea hybrida]